MRQKKMDSTIVFCRGKGGEPSCPGEAVILYINGLTKFAVYLAFNIVTSQDLVQGTFVSLLENLHKIHDPSSLGTWLKTNLKNKYYDFIKSPKNYNLSLDLIGLETLLDHKSQNPDDVYQKLHDIAYSLNNLSVNERLIIVLVNFEKYTYKEASVII